jgi:hypothetical protein
VKRNDADELCIRLAAEHPDRGTHRWRAREEEDGDWIVVKIALPLRGDERTKPEMRADERPATPDDPGLDIARDVFGPYGA